MKKMINSIEEENLVTEEELDEDDLNEDDEEGKLYVSIQAQTVNSEDLESLDFDGTRKNDVMLWPGFSDMRFLLKGESVGKVISDGIEGQLFSLIQVKNEDCKKLRFYQVRDLGMEIIPAEGKGDPKYRYFLNISYCDYFEGRSESRLSFESIKHFKIHYTGCNGEIIRKTPEELLDFAEGCTLAYRTSYMYGWGSTRSPNQEPCINRHFVKDELKMHDPDRYYFVEDDVDIKIFVKKRVHGKNKETRIVPIDVRKLDANGRLLEAVNEIKGMYYEDARVVEYEAESPDISAQYCAVQYDSNRNWEADPSNFLNFRISAFLMPDGIESCEEENDPEKLVTDIETGEEYIVDSIYMNGDISYTVGAARAWIVMLYWLSQWD